MPYEHPTPEVKQGNVVNYVDETGNPIKKSIEYTESNVYAYDTTITNRNIGKDGKLYLFSKVKKEIMKGKGRRNNVSDIHL